MKDETSVGWFSVSVISASLMFVAVIQVDKSLPVCHEASILESVM